MVLKVSEKLFVFLSKRGKLCHSAVLCHSLTFFYFSFQKLKQKAEQNNADELKSVNEVLESYGY